MMEYVERCSEEVAQKGMSFAKYVRCSRKAVKDGYCRQHHPDAVKARKDKREAAAEKKWNNTPYKQLQRAVEEIGNLHNQIKELATSGPEALALKAKHNRELGELYQLACVESYFTPKHMLERFEKIRAKINKGRHSDPPFQRAMDLYRKSKLGDAFEKSAEVIDQMREES